MFNDSITNLSDTSQRIINNLNYSHSSDNEQKPLKLPPPKVNQQIRRKKRTTKSERDRLLQQTIEDRSVYQISEVDLGYLEKKREVLKKKQELLNRTLLANKLSEILRRRSNSSEQYENGSESNKKIIKDQRGNDHRKTEEEITEQKTDDIFRHTEKDNTDRNSNTDDITKDISEQNSTDFITDPKNVRGNISFSEIIEQVSDMTEDSYETEKGYYSDGHTGNQTRENGVNFKLPSYVDVTTNEGDQNFERTNNLPNESKTTINFNIYNAELQRQRGENKNFKSIPFNDNKTIRREHDENTFEDNREKSPTNKLESSDQNKEENGDQKFPSWKSKELLKHLLSCKSISSALFYILILVVLCIVSSGVYALCAKTMYKVSTSHPAHPVHHKHKNNHSRSHIFNTLIRDSHSYGKLIKDANNQLLKFIYTLSNATTKENSTLAEPIQHLQSHGMPNTINENEVKRQNIPTIMPLHGEKKTNNAERLKNIVTKINENVATTTTPMTEKTTTLDPILLKANSVLASLNIGNLSPSININDKSSIKDQNAQKEEVLTKYLTRASKSTFTTTTSTTPATIPLIVIKEFERDTTPQPWTMNFGRIDGEYGNDGDSNIQPYLHSFYIPTDQMSYHSPTNDYTDRYSLYNQGHYETQQDQTRGLQNQEYAGFNTNQMDSYSEKTFPNIEQDFHENRDYSQSDDENNFLRDKENDGNFRDNKESKANELSNNMDEARQLEELASYQKRRRRKHRKVHIPHPTKLSDEDIEDGVIDLPTMSTPASLLTTMTTTTTTKITTLTTSTTTKTTTTTVTTTTPITTTTTKTTSKELDIESAFPSPRINPEEIDRYTIPRILTHDPLENMARFGRPKEYQDSNEDSDDNDNDDSDDDDNDRILDKRYKSLYEPLHNRQDESSEYTESERNKQENPYERETKPKFGDIDTDIFRHRLQENGRHFRILTAHKPTKRASDLRPGEAENVKYMNIKDFQTLSKKQSDRISGLENMVKILKKGREKSVGNNDDDEDDDENGDLMDSDISNGSDEKKSGNDSDDLMSMVPGEKRDLVDGKQEKRDDKNADLMNEFVEFKRMKEKMNVEQKTEKSTSSQKTVNKVAELVENKRQPPRKTEVKVYHLKSCVEIKTFEPGELVQIVKGPTKSAGKIKYTVRSCTKKAGKHFFHMKCRDIIYKISTGNLRVKEKRKKDGKRIFAVYGCRNEESRSSRKSIVSKATTKTTEAKEAPKEKEEEEDGSGSGNIDDDGDDSEVDENKDSSWTIDEEKEKLKKPINHKTTESKQLGDLMNIVQDMRKELHQQKKQQKSSEDEKKKHHVQDKGESEEDRDTNDDKDDDDDDDVDKHEDLKLKNKHQSKSHRSQHHIKHVAQDDDDDDDNDDDDVSDNENSTKRSRSNKLIHSKHKKKHMKTKRHHVSKHTGNEADDNEEEGDTKYSKPTKRYEVRHHTNNKHKHLNDNDEDEEDEDDDDNERSTHRKQQQKPKIRKNFNPDDNDDGDVDNDDDNDDDDKDDKKYTTRLKKQKNHETSNIENNDDDDDDDNDEEDDDDDNDVQHRKGSKNNKTIKKHTAIAKKHT